MGETVVLGTATMSQKPRDLDFLPLVCDFEERKYAIGKIPGGFIKRGGRPSERATLTSRLIDRPIRPLFPKGMRHDLQVVAMAFSVDKECPPDVLGICAAGAALAVSDIPFDGPIAGVRVGHIDGEFVLFPSNEDLKESKIDLIGWPEGRLIMAYNNTTNLDWHERSPLSLAASPDEGLTWENIVEIAPAGGVKCQPAMCRGDDGLLHVIYMHRHTAVEHVVVELDV